MKSIRIAVYISIVLGFARKLLAKFFATPKKPCREEPRREVDFYKVKERRMQSHIKIYRDIHASNYDVAKTICDAAKKLCDAVRYTAPAGEPFYSSTRVLYKEKEND